MGNIEIGTTYDINTICKICKDWRWRIWKGIIENYNHGNGEEFNVSWTCLILNQEPFWQSD